MKDKELIRALRCMSSGTDAKNCKVCQFYTEEHLPEHLWEMNCGNEIWSYCDVDRIAIEAANRLEELLGDAHGQN